MVLNAICPSFAFANQWTCLEGVGGGVFENPKVLGRYRLGSIATASVQKLREARAVVKPETADSIAASGYDAHVYESIEYAQGFLLMSEEVLYSTDEHTGFTLGSFPTFISTYPNPRPEFTCTVSQLDAFAKIAFDYLYGADCLHRVVGAIHGDLHMNNKTVYRAGGTHIASKRGDSTTFTPIVETPLSTYVAGPRGEADTFVFPFTGVLGCIIDFSRALIGPEGYAAETLKRDNGEAYVTNFMRDQRNSVLRAFHRAAPTFTEKNQEALKAAILANPEAVFRVLSYTDFMSIGKSLVTVLDSKPSGPYPANFAPSVELKTFAKKVETTARDGLLTYLTDLVESKTTVEPKRIPYAGEALLPKLFAKYLYTAWDPAVLRKGTLVDAYNFNNKMTYSGTDYEQFPPWARLDKLEEHLGEVKLTDMFTTGNIKAFLESILPSPRMTILAEEVRAEQDALDGPASQTSSWIGGKASGSKKSKKGKTAKAPSLPELLYHGSQVEIKDGWLEPRPSRVINGEKAVFATNTKWMAIAFASGLKHTQIDLGIASGTPYLMEMCPNAFDLLKIPGYLYMVSSKGFYGDRRLGMKGAEFINKHRVKVLSAEHLPSLYDALIKDGVVCFVPAAQRAEFFREHQIPEWDKE